MEFNPSSNYHHTPHQPHHYHPSPLPPNPNLLFYPHPHHQDRIFTTNPHFSEHDQKLIDEVIYLHTLWRRGPPTPFHQFHHNPSFTLKPSSTLTKKKTRKNKNLRKIHLDSGKEWPVGPLPTCPSPPGSGWAPFRTAPGPARGCPVSGEEVARVSSLRVQLKGLDVCVGLFGKKSDGSDDDDGDDDEEEEYGDDCDEEVELMGKVFEGNDELRGYYEKKCWDGEFYCLVCGVIGGKFGKKYKNCLALVQHSVSILRTKKKRVHRGYAYVVCKVLGWDIDRLPSLPPSNCEGEANKHADDCDKNPNAVGDVEANLAKVNDSQKEVAKCDRLAHSEDDDVKKNPDDVESGVTEPGVNVEVQ